MLFKRLAAASLALTLAASLTACSQKPAANAGGTTPPASPAPQDGNTSQPAEQTQPADSAPAETASALSVAIKKVNGREYMVYGRTTAAPELHLVIEDGHKVLFGPAPIAVTDGRFRIDFAIDETDQAQFTAGLSYQDSQGNDQVLNVPVRLSQELTTAGSAFDVNDIPPLPGEVQAGDKRTKVTDEGVESPHFKLKWPQVTEGDTNVRLEGQTDLFEFWAEIRRGDQVLGSYYLGGEHNNNGQWHEFQANLPAEGGFREGDAVVLKAGQQESEVELVIQPIRN